MKKEKTIAPILGPLFQKLAPKIGARVIMEPKWGIVGQIIFANGKKRYFRYSSIDLNTLGASEIAKDKDYSYFFMKKLGYPTIPGQAFFSTKWCRAIGSQKNIDAAYRYAKKIGFPVIVKPNSGSQGTNVAKVNNKREFYLALKKIFATDHIALVQTFVIGKDYRIVILDNKIISAYQRLPFTINGDGKSNIKKLIKQRLTALAVSGRTAKLKSDDPRLLRKLKECRLGLNSILGRAEKLTLLDNANLSTGGDSLDVTGAIHPEFKKIAIKLAKDMGLRLAGIDLMIAGDISEKPNKYWVIEINAAPGLDHYIKTGAVQEKIVAAMYLQILKAMAK